MKEGKFSIEKSTVECYKIRHSSGMNWADITIDSNRNAGRISIASDYGEWQRYWGSCGKSFKNFLIGLDLYYIAGKFGCSNWFDMYKTISEFKSVIEANFDDGNLDKDKYEEALSELESLEHESSCKDEFCQNLKDCSQIMKLYDHCPALIYGVDPAFKNFWDLIWPEFVNEIKHELDSVTIPVQ